jgi:hypothetical protein
MSTSSFKVKKSLNIESGGTASENGDLTVNSNRLEFHNGSAAANVVTASSTDTLTNKTITGNTAVNLVSGSGTLTLNTSGTATIPNATDTLVGKATTDTLTNKTFDADGTGNSITNIENADIKAAAAIALDKLAATTASRALASDPSGFVTASATTATELGYVNGVTSAIQTQLNTNATSISDHISDATDAHAGTAITNTPSGNLAATTVQAALNELQTDVDGRIANTLLSTAGDIIYASGANTPARLAIGAANTFLSSNGTNVSWATPAGSPLSVVSKTTTYTATTSDDVIFIDTSGGAWTLTLYAASGNSGRRLRIIKTTNDFAALTIDGNSSETINGSTTTTLNTQYEELEIVCDGSNWLILSRRIPSTWTSYTPTGSWTTNSTYTGFWKRSGDSIEIDARISLSGAPDNTTLTMTVMPSGLTIDTAKLTLATSRNLLTCNVGLDDSGTRPYLGAAAYSSTTAITIQYYNTTAASPMVANTNISGNAVPFTWANGDNVLVKLKLPVSGWNG